MKKNILFLIIITIFCFNINVNAKTLNPSINSLNIVEYRFDNDDPNDVTNAPGSNFTNTDKQDNYDWSVKGDSCPIFIDSETGQTNELYDMVQEAFTFIKILTPILVGILSLIDYIKAITSSSDDEIKKATQRTVKRLIVGIILFFLPFLLDLLFDIFGLTDVSRCGIGT